MDESVNWHRKKLIEKAAGALGKNNYSVFTENYGGAAVSRVLELVKPGENVAFGGSMTIEALGIREALEKRGAKIIASSQGAPKEEKIKIRRQSLAADIFIASPNAVTLDGKLIFMDKIGNRAAGMMFGPSKVIAVAGFNKIVADEKAARKRIENAAGPMNAKRLSASTPCAETGVCADCNSPERICNILVTLLKKPAFTDYHVILVPEEFGY
jgi:L-lactate utilization protein LutB